MKLPYRLLRPLLFRLDPETAHDLSLAGARLVQRLPVVRRSRTYESLSQHVFGLHFPNPVGIAAGLDKNARCLPFWQKIGCGFAEVGSVSARSSQGNPKPRMFRLEEDRALVNRMGLNNDGAAVVAERIIREKPEDLILGINLVKTNDPDIEKAAAVEDFINSYRKLSPLAGYVVLNISCPNTADGKTFEEARALEDLLQAFHIERSDRVAAPPLLVKLSPPEVDEHFDPGSYAELVQVTDRFDIAGYVVANTAPDRAGLNHSQKMAARIGAGGMSGSPLWPRARVLIRHLYRLTDGQRPIIGVGGIMSYMDAFGFVLAGASLIQTYTGLVYEGPSLVRRINEGLVRVLDERRWSTLADAVGAEA